MDDTLLSFPIAYWRYAMEKISAICEGKPLVTGVFPSQIAINAEPRYFSLAGTNCWIKSPVASNMRRHDAHVTSSCV